jgi:hypothetical protein
MCLSNCYDCKFVTKELHHSTDIGCAIVPAYWEMWYRLKDLPTSSIGCMPIEPCWEFEESEEMKALTLSITLTRQQWQLIATNRNAPEDFTQQVLSSIGLESSANTITMIPVSSSNIQAIGYNPTERLLQVDFHSGRSYQYYGVLPQTFQDFLNTSSKGRFFNAQIKGCYLFDEI